ncbi:MAG: diguanylate cyclase [Magnetococcales bacterium]|nr:diguanylate cyclase [Magnetococcales bacterium]
MVFNAGNCRNTTKSTLHGVGDKNRRLKVWYLRNWPILPKILFISFLGVTLILGVTFSFFIPYVESHIISGKKNATKQTVEVAYGVLEHFNFLVTNGTYQPEQAQELAKSAIKQLRYHEKEYFWINDETPKMVMHPTVPDLDGKDLTDFSDPNGVFLFQEFVRVTQSKGGGFVQYMWPKPGGKENVPVSKISYVKRFKPWGWIIGSGIYLDDVERDISDLRSITMWGAIFFTFVTMMLSFWIGRSITLRLDKVIDGLKEVAQGKGDVDQRKCIAITSIDEIGTLSSEFNALMESISNLTRFRKVIEEDENINEVYSRLWDVFTLEIGFKEVVIFEVDEIHGVMKLAYPLNFQEDRMYCSPDILDQCGLCKAKRTGHEISSLDFHKICKQFLHMDEPIHHVCLPMTIGGGIMGVVQFIFNQREKGGINPELIAGQVDKASQFIKEALPVIESKRLTATLRESALVDPMTGLHNRRFLQECANGLCSGSKRRGKSIGILMGDLDFFKQVNDTHGHDVGDEVLKKTANILRDTVRESDLVVRFGGEEFIVILVDIEEEELVPLAEKLRKQIEAAEFAISGQPPLKKTISIGASIYPEDEDGFWKTLKFADVALYKAKEEGRNRTVRFTKEMWEQQQY